MSQTPDKSVFHRPPANPSKPVLQSARPRPAAVAASRSRGLDPRIIWGGAGAAALLIVLLALRPVGFGILELFFLAGILLWLVSPLVGALIWQRKGGHVAMGFFGGLFLGPLVLLMLLLDAGKKKCPSCAGWIPKKARVCGNCREAV